MSPSRLRSVCGRRSAATPAPTHVPSWILAVLAASWGCGSESPPLCTSCTPVAGRYGETAQEATIDCHDGMMLFFSGGSGSVVVGQAESKLLLTALGSSFTGELHSDGSAAFGPIPAMAQPRGDSGAPVPGQLRLEGWFTASGSSTQADSFAGSYVFVADSNGCELDGSTAWRR